MWCPGCDDAHAIRDGLWEWDGNVDQPTISPSILVTLEFGAPGLTDRRCHSFVRNGQWQFLADCTHALSGQTVPMVPFPQDRFRDR